MIRLEVTKSGKRRDLPLNDDSYHALVSLGPKAAGRVFRLRSHRTAFDILRHTFASWAMMRGVSLKDFRSY